VRRRAIDARAQAMQALEFVTGGRPIVGVADAVDLHHQPPSVVCACQQRTFVKRTDGKDVSLATVRQFAHLPA
jgi:hypothetical protein